mmetsp:Transcript_43943/g.116128  ORF Transcript_43943/g.116128 Transcript_43943/m.116128 type:complete len:346 (-) Transcript_43943:536-1573(-)
MRRFPPRFCLGGRRWSSTPRVIDVHAHVVLDEVSGAAGSYGPEVGEEAGQPFYRIGEYYLRGVKYKGSPFMDPEVRIARMDACGIDLQVLSPNPLTYFHHIPLRDAVSFCQKHNDALAELVQRYPGRLLGLAAVPMQSPYDAARELERATTQLGLVGAGCGTEFPFELDSPEMDTFYAACCDLNVPVFMHPAPRGIDGPPADPKLKRFELDVILGFSLEATVAISTIVFGQVFERHPRLDLCFPSGGGAISFLAARAEVASRSRPWVPGTLREPGALHSALRRIWVDTHVHDDGAFQLIRKHLGDDRLVFGTNFAGWDQAEGPSPPVLDGVDVLGNAKRLLRLPR